MRRGGPAVGDQDAAVGAPVQAVAKQVSGFRWAHGDHRDGRPAAVLDLQGQFQGMEIVRIEHRRQRRPVDRAVVFHRLTGDRLGVGHLLGQNRAMKHHAQHPPS